MGRKLLLGAFLLSSYTALGAQTPGPTAAETQLRRFRVLDAALVSTLRNELQRAADQGYRIIAATSGRKGMALLLERLPEGMPNRKYIALASADLGSLERNINEAGMHGFRLIPGAALSKSSWNFGDLFWTALLGAVEDAGHPGSLDQGPSPEEMPFEVFVVMERKTPNDGPYRYTYSIFSDPRPTAPPLLPGAEYSYPGRADAEIVAVIDHQEGVVMFQEERVPSLAVWRNTVAHWLAYPKVDAEEPHYRIVVAEGIADMQKRLADYTGLQRRIISTSTALQRDTLLIAYREAGEHQRIEQTMVTATRKRDLQEQLNARAAQGYRVVPRTMLRRSRYGVMMEKVAEAPPAYQYRVRGGTEQTLEELMNEMVEPGDLIVGFVKGSQLAVIIEKPLKP